MAYGNAHMHLGASIHLRSEDELYRAVMNAFDLDFGDYGPGAGWVFGELRWQPDGSAQFEGVGDPNRVVVMRAEGEDEMVFLNRVLNHWKAFTADLIAGHEARMAEVRAVRSTGAA